jgi:hypothetical protein
MKGKVMDKLTIETPAQWLKAQELKQSKIIGALMPSLYIKETVVYEFYKWSTHKAMFTGFALGLGFAVAVAAIVKLAGW